MKILKYITLFAIAGIALSSCKKDGCTDEFATNYDEKAKNDDGTCEYQDMALSLHFHLTHDGTEKEFNQDMTDDHGNTFQINRFDFYVSNPNVVNDEGTQLWSFDKHVLVSGPGHYDLGSYTMETIQHWHMVKFGVGVTTDLNDDDPTLLPADNDLSPQTPSMHWNWNSGYRFIVIEGKVDTDADNVVDTDFVYHIGMDDLFRDASVMIHENVDITASKMISLNIDVKKVLSTIDIKNNLSTHTMDNMPLATLIADNFVTAMSKAD